LDVNEAFVWYFVPERRHITECMLLTVFFCYDLSTVEIFCPFLLSSFVH